MKRTACTLAFCIVSTCAALAQTPEPISTVGPVALCESQALIQTFFNPHGYTISKAISLIAADSGRIIDSQQIHLLPTPFPGFPAVWIPSHCIEAELPYYGASGKTE